MGPGVWGEFLPTSPTEVLALLVLEGEDGWIGQAKFLDLALVTLPELTDAGTTPEHSAQDRAYTCLKAGYGQSLGVCEAKSEDAARVGASKLAQKYREGGSAAMSRAEREEAIAKRARLSFSARRAEKFRAQAPDDYLAGFLIGAARKSLPPVKGEEQEGVSNEDAREDGAKAAFEAGWRHGWEYAVGRLPWPEWASSTRTGGAA